MSRLPKKTLFKSTTSLSINERFTQLRGIAGQSTIRPARTNTNRENNALLQQASIKNRRLAQQMERRPNVVAALKIKKKSIRQRLGPFENSSSVRARLQLPGTSGVRRIGGTFRGRVLGNKGARGRLSLRGRLSVLASPHGIRRSSFLRTSMRGTRRGSLIRRRETVLQRLTPRTSETVQQRRLPITSEIQSSRPIGNQLFRGGPRGSRLRGRRLQGSGLNRNQFRANQLRTNQTRGSQLRRNQPRGSGFRESRGRRGYPQQNRGQLRGNYRGRGRGGQQRFRGSQQRNQRVSFRGFQRNRFEPKPSKEELDNELDQYMSNTQSRVDNQLDLSMRRDSSNSWH